MAYKSFSIESFAGGLNTAVAPSRLDPKFSPDLENVDFTETGAITRRNGYASITGSVAFGGAVDALFRYYQTDGDKYWMAVSGTAVWSRVSSVTNVPEATIEVESATVTGTHTHISNGGFSGGACVAASNNLVISVPYSTAISLKWYSPVQASLRVDSGAYVNATEGTYSWGSLTATTHTITMKPKARNAKSLKLSIPAVSTPTERYAYASRVTGLTTSGHLRVKFYDDNAFTGTTRSVGVHAAIASQGIGIVAQNGYYNVCGVPDSSWSTIAWSLERRARSAGWHTLDFYKDTNGLRIYLDGTILSDVGMTSTDLSYISTSLYEGGLFTNTAQVWYVDGLMRESDPNGSGYQMTLVDDCEVSTGWTLTTAAGGIVAVSTDQCDTEKFSIFPDYFIYSAIGTWTKQNGTLSATTDQFAFAALNDKVYINSPYDRLLRFNGTSTVNATSVTATPPRGGYMIEHKRRLWTAGDYADPAVLYYSDVDEPEDWTGGGSIYLAGKDSGGRCTGLTSFDNKVFYFSDSRIYAIDPTGPDTNWSAGMAGYNSISWSLGCIAPRSLVQTDNALIFLSADGVRAYGYIQGMYSQDGSGLIDLSENIRPTLDTMSDALKAKCAGAFFNGRYWLACGLEDGATGNDSVLVYKLPQGNQPGSWTLYSNMPIASFFVTRGDEYGLYGGGTDGNIYRMEYGENDNGSPITMRYVTPELAPGGFEAIKHFSTLSLAAESSTDQSITVGVNTDDAEYPDQTAAITSNTAAQPVRLLVSSRGRSIQYELTSSGAAQPLTVSRLTTSYLPEKAR